MLNNPTVHKIDPVSIASLPVDQQPFALMSLLAPQGSLVLDGDGARNLQNAEHELLGSVLNQSSQAGGLVTHESISVVVRSGFVTPKFERGLLIEFRSGEDVVLVPNTAGNRWFDPPLAASKGDHFTGMLLRTRHESLPTIDVVMHPSSIDHYMERNERKLSMQFSAELIRTILASRGLVLEDDGEAAISVVHHKNAIDILTGPIGPCECTPPFSGPRRGRSV